MNKRVNETEADVPCLKNRVFAHFWRLGKPTPKDQYVTAKCDHCKKKRLYRLHHPAKMDWKRTRANRKREETRRRKKGEL